jgi:hypothetical protein
MLKAASFHQQEVWLGGARICFLGSAREWGWVKWAGLNCI